MKEREKGGGGGKMAMQIQPRNLNGQAASYLLLFAGNGRRRAKRVRENSPPQGADEWQVAGGSGSGPTATGKGKSGKAPRGGVHTRSKALRHQGNLICYLYNNRGPGCQRAPATGGCDDGKGGVYAHVCNFDKGGGVICAAAHPRCKNH